MKHPSYFFKKRLKLFLYGISALVLLVIARLFQLQIKNFNTFFVRGERNFLRIEKISSPRGNILDCKGRPLATNRPVTKMHWCGTGKKSLDESQKKLLEFLGFLFLQNFIQNPDVLDAERLGKKIILAYDVPIDILRKILEQYPQHKNLFFSTCFKREYPHKTIASHIIGYLGFITTDFEGRMGLEKMYEDALRGVPGQLCRKVNSRGMLLEEEELKKTQQGEDLLTTLDLDLQNLAESVFPQELAGACLIMNPKTGALKVIISRPEFDPNIFVETLETSQWEGCKKEKQPFLNRAFGALYPPASLFKLITMAAALENQIVDIDGSWNCCGYTTFSGRKYYCHKHAGHGSLSTMQAIALSCNIPFFEIGKRIKIDQLADYARRFGLGSKTGNVLPEKAGLVPTSLWKMQTKGEPWWPGETLSAAIGQSFLLVTPVQMVRMVAALCEGYLVNPCIVQKEADEQKNAEKQMLVISEKTRLFLKQSMMKAATSGTGKKLSRDRDLEIYAKTGTAQTCSLEKGKLGERRFRDHAWVVAHVTYKNNDPFVLLVLLEHAGFSSVATSVAKNFLRNYCAFVDSQTKEEASMP